MGRGHGLRGRHVDADELDAKLRFARQLGMLVADEDTYFVDSFAELGVAPAAYLHPELTIPTAGFRDLIAASRKYSCGSRSRNESASSNGTSAGT